MRTPLIILSTLMVCGCAMQAARNADAFTASYHCANGQSVQARYLPPDRARITIGERTIDMHLAVSADGARYVGGGLTWWTKGGGPGSRATLFTYDAGTGVTGERITTCVQTAKE